MNWHANINNLPADCRDHLHRLGDGFDTALGVLRAIEARLANWHERRQAIMNDRASEAQRTEKPLSRARQEHFESRLAAIRPEGDRLRAQELAARQEWENRSALAVRVNDFLGRRCPAKPKLAGKPRSMTMEAARSGLADLAERRRAFEQAPLKRAAYVAFIQQAIGEAGRLAAISFDPRAGNDDAFGLTDLLEADGTTPTAKALPTPLPTSLPSAGALALLFRVFRDPIVAALADLIPEDGPDALDQDERASMLIAIDLEILDMERAEEAAIRKAEASGLAVLRRANAAPLAVLGIEAR